MRMLRPFVLMLVVVVLASVQDARATGLGLYFDYGNVFDGQLDDTIAGDIDYDEDHFGGGFSFDTNVAADKLFNYRLDVGYQHVEGEYGAFGDLDGDGFVLDNAFGFGVFRSDLARVWIGPAVRLSFDFFDNVPVFDDVFKFGVGVGPEVGVNLHTGDLVSIGLTGGYQIRYVVAEPDGSYSTEDGYEQMGFIKMHVLFRLDGDSFGDSGEDFHPSTEETSSVPVVPEPVEGLGEGEGRATPASRSDTVPSAPAKIVVERKSTAPPAGRSHTEGTTPANAVVETEHRTVPVRQSADDTYNMRVWNEQQRHSK